MIFPKEIDSFIGVSSVEAFSAALQVLKHDWSHIKPKMCLRQGPGSGVKHEIVFWCLKVCFKS